MRRRLFWHACHLRPGPRCEDLPPAEKAQRRFHRIILVVPPILNADGTTSASSKQDAYFIPFLRDLHQYGPEGMWQKVCDPPSSAYLLAKPCPQAQGSLSHQPFATLRQASYAWEPRTNIMSSALTRIWMAKSGCTSCVCWVSMHVWVAHIAS
jgi:hypothetical protein